MVEYNNIFGLFQQFRTFCVAWSVRIHNHNQSVSAHHLKCTLTVNEHILRISLFFRKAFHKWTDRACRIIYYNLRLLSKYLGSTVNSHSSSKRIYIWYAVSHNQDILTALYNFLQSLRFYTRFYAVLILNLLCLSSVIGNLVALFYYNLIPTTAKSKVYRSTRILIIVIVSIIPNSNTNAQGYCHLISNLDGFDLFQNMELIFTHLLQIFVLKYNKIFVFFNFPAQGIHLRKILVHLPVNQCF